MAFNCIKKLTLGLFLGVALATPAVAHSLKDLESQLLEREAYVEIVNRPAPDFTQFDASGAEVSLSDFRGKVVLLNFIYAGCPDFCPLHSEILVSIQKQISDTPMRDRVQFISITTDPVRDTPNVLVDYGKVHGFDQTNWVVLTSGADQPDATRELAKRYGLKFTPVSDDYQVHGVVTHLIDKNGNLRARYHGLKFNQTNLIVHLNALTNDYH